MVFWDAVTRVADGQQCIVGLEGEGMAYLHFSNAKITASTS